MAGRKGSKEGSEAIGIDDASSPEEKTAPQSVRSVGTLCQEDKYGNFAVQDMESLHYCYDNRCGCPPSNLLLTSIAVPHHWLHLKSE